MRKTKTTSRRPFPTEMDELLNNMKGYAGPAEPTSVEVLLKKILSYVEPKHEFPPILQTEGAIMGRMTASELKAESPIRSRPTLDDLILRLSRAADRANVQADRFGYLANRLGADNPFLDGGAELAQASPVSDNFIDTAWALVGILHNSLDQLDRDYDVLSQLEGKPPPPAPSASPSRG